MTLPEHYENGAQDFISSELSDPYADLVPLGQRKPSEIKLKSADGASEAELAAKFGFSQPITQVSQLARKFYGYERDGNVDTLLGQNAVKGTNALTDFILNAPCVNRQGRYDEEDVRAKQWLKEIDANPDGREEKLAGMYELLARWSEADAFMLQARIVEEQRGIDAAEALNDEYDRMTAQRDAVQMEAAKLPPAYNMLFWCRIRQYQIMRERAYAAAMGYPIHDFTDVKRKLADGADIHDLISAMPWAFQESYQMVMGSMMDGEAHRTLLMSMIAGQLPRPPMPAWGMPPGYWPGMSPNGGQPDDDDGPPDTRKALFNFGGRREDPQEPPKNQNMRRRNGRRRNGRQRSER